MAVKRQDMRIEKEAKALKKNLEKRKKQEQELRKLKKLKINDRKNNYYED